MQQPTKPGHLIDLDGVERNIAELMERHDLTRAGVYRRSEVREGVRYFRAAKRAGYPRGMKRKQAA